MWHDQGVWVGCRRYCFFESGYWQRKSQNYFILYYSESWYISDNSVETRYSIIMWFASNCKSCQKGGCWILQIEYLRHATYFPCLYHIFSPRLIYNEIIMIRSVLQSTVSDNVFNINLNKMTRDFLGRDALSSGNLS